MFPFCKIIIDIQLREIFSRLKRFRLFHVAALYLSAVEISGIKVERFMVHGKSVAKGIHLLTWVPTGSFKREILV